MLGMLGRRVFDYDFVLLNLYI